MADPCNPGCFLKPSNDPGGLEIQQEREPPWNNPLLSVSVMRWQIANPFYQRATPARRLPVLLCPRRSCTKPRAAQRLQAACSTRRLLHAGKRSVNSVREDRWHSPDRDYSKGQAPGLWRHVSTQASKQMLRHFSKSHWILPSLRA